MHVRSEFAGSGQNTSDLFMTASVELMFLKSCQGILRVNSVQVKEEYVPIVEKNYDDYEDYSSTNNNDEEETFHPASDKIAEDIQRHGLR